MPQLMGHSIIISNALFLIEPVLARRLRVGYLRKNVLTVFFLTLLKVRHRLQATLACYSNAPP